ncbi:universal stress protein [Haloplanus sp. GCM10025708]|uniref:universal stress protein n=1 Tax=Haloferacaceae TaxID=1644056 RepID=UPI00362266E1
MTNQILVPVDGSEPSEKALDFALEQFPDADVVALTVVDPTDIGYASIEATPNTFQKLHEAARKEAERVLGEARDRAAERDREIGTETSVGAPSRAIVDYAEEHDVDQIVIGSHGRKGVTRVLLGSVAEAVVRRSPVPVTVVR